MQRGSQHLILFSNYQAPITTGWAEAVWHMTSSRNQTPDLMTLSPRPYPQGHMLLPTSNDMSWCLNSMSPTHWPNHVSVVWHSKKAGINLMHSPFVTTSITIFLELTSNVISWYSGSMSPTRWPNHVSVELTNSKIARKAMRLTAMLPTRGMEAIAPLHAAWRMFCSSLPELV